MSWLECRTKPRAYDAADSRSYVTPRPVPAFVRRDEFDSVAKIEAMRSFASVFSAARVPAIEIELPWTGPAFDPFMGFIARFGARLPSDSRFSPLAQTALCDLDRFLAFALTLPAAPPWGPTAPPAEPEDRRRSRWPRQGGSPRRRVARDRSGARRIASWR